MKRKIVIILEKDDAEKFFEDGPPSHVFSSVRKQLKDLDAPEVESTTRIGDAVFGVVKEHCPRCGFQVFPSITNAKCVDCGWRGFDDDLKYLPVRDGDDTYENHCPECDSTKIKREKEDAQDS